MKTKTIKGNTKLNKEDINIDIKDTSTDTISEESPNEFLSPVYNIKRISTDNIRANDYNPNSVASPEMALLVTSVLNDGFTQPIVVSPDPDDGNKYILVDGFHRFTIAVQHPEINKREQGTVPCVILNKSLPDRIASTIRHNRARGSHDVQVMSKIVQGLIESGLGDDYISKNLGMDKEELLRLKQVSGLQKLFLDSEFKKAWITE